MRTSAFLWTTLLGLLHLSSAHAQRLLWERASIPAGAPGNDFCNNVTLVGGQHLLLVGSHANPIQSTGCLPGLRAYFRTYTLAGVLVNEKPGRNLNSGTFDLAVGSLGVGWFSGAASSCTSNRRYARLLVQRMTLAGDTGRAWYMGAVPPPATQSRAILVQGNKIVTAGVVTPTAPANQLQQVQLTCSDTLGRVRWQRNYARPTYTRDEASSLVATPRGGYLVSGDAYNIATFGYDHYVIETDSGGNLRRSRLIQPLGPGYNTGYRAVYQCNVLVLPNAQGYLLSGTADSMQLVTSFAKIAYIMRLDTALNVQWVYRHPPRLAGTNVRSNYGFRIRLLPNNTVGLMLTDVRGAGTPAAYLAQVDIASGRRVGFYQMLSNSQQLVRPYDWQWVGDGTLLLCGQSAEAGVTGLQSYVARWDFRGTPLLATRPAAPVRHALALSPNPAAETLTVGLPGLDSAQPATVALFDGLGRCVRTQAATLGAAATARLNVRGLPAGLYAVRVRTAGADYVGRVVVE